MLRFLGLRYWLLMIGVAALLIFACCLLMFSFASLYCFTDGHSGWIFAADSCSSFDATLIQVSSQHVKPTLLQDGQCEAGRASQIFNVQRSNSGAASSRTPQCKLKQRHSQSNLSWRNAIQCKSNWKQEHLQSNSEITFSAISRLPFKQSATASPMPRTHPQQSSSHRLHLQCRLHKYNNHSTTTS